MATYNSQHLTPSRLIRPSNPRSRRIKHHKRILQQHIPKDRKPRIRPNLNPAKAERTSLLDRLVFDILSGNNGTVAAAECEREVWRVSVAGEFVSAGATAESCVEDLGVVGFYDGFGEDEEGCAGVWSELDGNQMEKTE
jgi:hypothetical protein